MERQAAETLAIDALSWLAADSDLLGVFLGASGASVDDLRSQAANPEFLVAVLDFILMDDAWVTGFCDSARVPYDAPIRARAALPGGEEVSWT